MGNSCSFPFWSEKAEGGADEEKKPVEYAYFNNAGQCSFSDSVKTAGVAALNRQPWEMTAVEDERQVRTLFGKLIGADGSDIAIMPSTAFAITLAAQNVFRINSRAKTGSPYIKGSGGKVLVLQDQYPSAIYPWQELCDRSIKQPNYNKANQWSMVVVPYPEEEYGVAKRTWTEAIIEHLSTASNHDIRVVVLPSLHWADGRIINLERISHICRARDITFVVDATQAVGAMPINVDEIQPSLLACSTHKWLRGPSGMSLVYIDPKLHTAWQPLDDHERGRDMPGDYYVDSATRHFMDSTTGFYPETFYRDARKFDAGGKANPLLLPMMRASLRLVAKLDLKALQRELSWTMKPLLDWCSANGFVVPPQPHVYHLIGIQPPVPMSPKQLVQIARYLEKEKHVLVQARCGGFRISPYTDTKPQHVRRLIQGLDEVFFGEAVGVWA